jgi:hypothetical protein
VKTNLFSPARFHEPGAPTFLPAVPARGTITLRIAFAVRDVALARAIAESLLNRIDFAEITVVYFLNEVPLLLGMVGAYCHLRAPLPLSLPASARV